MSEELATAAEWIEFEKVDDSFSEGADLMVVNGMDSELSHKEGLVRRKDAEEAIEAAHTRGVEDAIEIMEMAMKMSKSELEELISRFGESTESNKTLDSGRGEE